MKTLGVGPLAPLPGHLRVNYDSTLNNITCTGIDISRMKVGNTFNIFIITDTSGSIDKSVPLELPIQRSAAAQAQGKLQLPYSADKIGTCNSSCLTVF